MHQIPIKQCSERWKVKPVEGCILAATNKTPAPQTGKTTCGQSTWWCNVLHFWPSHHPIIAAYSIVPRHCPTSCHLQYGKAGAVFRTARGKNLGGAREWR